MAKSRLTNPTLWLGILGALYLGWNDLIDGFQTDPLRLGIPALIAMTLNLLSQYADPKSPGWVVRTKK